MRAVAVLVLAVGVADLIPRAKVLTGVAAAVALALGLGLGWHSLWLALLVTLVVVIWVDAARHRSGAGLWAFGVTVVGLIIGSPGLDPRSAPLDDWYRSLDIPAVATVDLDRAALALAVVVFLATAANVVVRHALTASGPQIEQVGQSIKGGRLLGPLERWLVFGFAVSGHLGSIAVIIAAKGILRFPEISRDEPDGMRAEYVLIGSFVSWALALVFVPLL